MNVIKDKGPGPGQESVWDYPRPPRLEAVKHHLVVMYDGRIIAASRAGYRVLETSHPPTYYLPPADVHRERLVSGESHSFCEFKGRAAYWSLCTGARVSHNAAWSYPTPTEAFMPIAGYFAFYPSRVDACFVDGEQVRPQAGDFYGGWITSRIVGPFKGPPGTGGW